MRTRSIWVPRGIIALVLTALLSAVPVALPATFTLAATLGAKTLALKGVLLTRLSALHEAAMIDVLCADKTGTLTANELAVAAVRAVKDGYGEGGYPRPCGSRQLAGRPGSDRCRDSSDGRAPERGAPAVRGRAFHAVRSGGQDGGGRRARPGRTRGPHRQRSAGGGRSDGIDRRPASPASCSLSPPPDTGFSQWPVDRQAGWRLSG